MYKLYWGNYSSGYSLIGEYKNRKSMSSAMNEYLKEIKFKNYYFRQWNDDEGFTMCDYGSHTNFFKFKNEDE